jgi:hypothetical protein
MIRECGHHGRRKAGPPAYCGGGAYGFTGHVGVSGQWVRWGWYLSIGFGIAFDGHGHIAVYSSTGGGKSVGASAGAGGQFGLSNADTVCGLGGPFANVSASFGDGGGGTIDGFGGRGDGPGGVVTGLTATIGPTVGGSATYGGLNHEGRTD